MENSEVLKLIKKRKRIFTLSVAVAVILGFIIFNSNLGILQMVILVLVDLSVAMFPPTIIFDFKLEKILTHELNPQKYYKVIHGANAVSKDNREDILIAYYIGDYLGSKNLCIQQIAKQKRAKNIELYHYLSLINFETNNLEELKITYQQEKKLLQNLNSKAILPYKIYCDYFDAYLNEDYNECKKIFTNIQQIPEEKRAPSFNLRTEFYYAIACYKNNDIDEAKQHFENIAQSCPNFYIATVSNEYIVAIDNNVQHTPNTIDSNPVCEVENIQSISSKKKKIDKWQIIKSILVLIALVFCFINASKIDPAYTAYDIIAENTEIKEIITVHNVNKDKDAFCIYSVDEETFGVAYLNYYDYDLYKYGTSTHFYEFELPEDNARHVIKAGDCNTSFRFMITDDNNIASKGEQFISFDFNSNTYYLCITETKKDNCIGYSYYLDIL